ncbi:hypothetical protein ACFXG4_32655 [Nocardia sp. NPDC059246]|uniref:hypothetical protein n=1 Tax=unclassified Nocardia TaxID=2637762 RepID=UPI0036BCBBC7
MSNSSKPTPVQMKVLKAVHNQAAMARLMQDRANAREQTTGQARPTSWYEDFHGHALLRQQLENAAAAAAIPTAWIDQCRERGDRGMRWRADLHWREPAPIPRHHFVAELEGQVRHLQGMAAVAAIYGEVGARAEVGTAQLFDRKLRVLAQHARAIASVLTISAAEGDRLWGAHTWDAAATTVRDLNTAELGKRWRGYAGIYTTDLALQTKALGDVGLPAEGGVWERMTPAHMIDEIRTRLSATPHQPGADAPPGTQITEAIEVAGIPDGVDTPLDVDTSVPHAPARETTPGIEL